MNVEAETLPLDDGEARIIVFPLRGAHLLERERQRTLSNPHRTNTVVKLAQRLFICIVHWTAVVHVFVMRPRTRANMVVSVGIWWTPLEKTSF